MGTKQRFRLLFFGSDSFSVRVLGRLLERDVCPIEVTSSPDSQLATFAFKQNLAIHPWRRLSSCWPNERLNVGLVASFGHMIKSDIVRRLPEGLFNVHPSLLPQYRGSSPIQAAIRHGLEETGCTIMRIPPVDQFDIGDIVLQEKLTIMSGELAIHLSDRLADLGASLAIRLLSDFELCLTRARPQGEHGMSYAKKLKPQDGLMKFSSENSASLECQFRAYSGFIDVYTVCLDGLKVRLQGMESAAQVARYDLDRLASELIACDRDSSNLAQHTTVGAPSGASPGFIYFHKLRHLLCVKCGDGQWLAFRMAWPASSPPQSSLDFYNGYLSKLRPHQRRTDV